ncbi:hypothetical protein VTL71DRAFT_14174 [Oculimacula yallundae]|uniref:RNA helicase n=1 Tax=Oculimacula yallundae TaxID=86028 RepID=A0ABR4CHQ3_9HELO
MTGPPSHPDPDRGGSSVGGAQPPPDSRRTTGSSNSSPPHPSAIDGRPVGRVIPPSTGLPNVNPLPSRFQPKGPAAPPATPAAPYVRLNPTPGFRGGARGGQHQRRNQRPSMPTPRATPVAVPTFTDAPAPVSSAWASLPSRPASLTIPETQADTMEGVESSLPVTMPAQRDDGDLAFKGHAVKASSRKTTDGQHTKRALEQTEAAKAAKKAKRDTKEIEAINTMHNWLNGEPRGSDVMGGEFAKNWARPKPAMFVTKNVDSKDINLPVWHSTSSYNVKYNMSTQEPALKITSQEVVGENRPSFQIPGNYLTHWKVGQEAVAFDKAYIPYAEISHPDMALNLQKIISVFSEQLFISDMETDIAEQVFNFATNTGPNPGLTLFAFRIAPVEFNRYPTEPALSHLIEIQRPRVCLIRNNEKCTPVQDELFTLLMSKAAGHGTHWGYGMEKKRGDEWIEFAKLEPPQLLQHLPWLANPREPGQTGPTTYASMLPQFDYSWKPKVYRDMMSAALIFDMQASEQSLDQLCNGQRLHKALVMDVTKGKIVTLDVTFNRPDESPSVPRLTNKSHVAIRIPYQDADMNTVYLPFIVDVMETDDKIGDVKLYFNAQQFAEHFPLKCEISLLVDVRHSRTSYIRQLQAVRDLTRGIKPGQPGYDLQQVLLGSEDPRTEPFPAHIDSASPDQIELQAAYKAACGHNDMQAKVIEHALTTQKLLTLVKGPPGTGKSITSSSEAVLVSTCNKHVLACAPSNTAALQLFRRISFEHKVMQTLDKKKVYTTKLIFLPTIGEVKDQLMNYKGLKNLDPNSYACHFMALKEADMVDMTKDAAFRDAARNFVYFCQDKKNRGDSDAYNKLFAEPFAAEWARVFDEAKESLIVVSTCNNSRVFSSTKIWIPDHFIVDEAAFTQLPDSLIPITLALGRSSKRRGGIRGSLAGDPEQLQPVVVSHGQNDYGKVLGYSLFSHMADTEHHDMFMLTLNYRMHVRVAHLPGMLVYDWLGSADNTWYPTPASKALDEFWNSAAAEQLRNNRRLPTRPIPQGVQQPGEKPSCRKLLFNTGGSRSAPAPGESSIRNFGNINTICLLVKKLVCHDGTYKLNPKSITILTPYKGQKLELLKQILARVPEAEGIHIDTTDSSQGAENDIVILDIPNAHEHRGSQLGFLKNWPRVNVALTRARLGLWIIGNLDQWRSEIQLLWADPKTRNWAFLIMDLIGNGDVVDILDGSNRAANFLPDLENLQDDKWTREIEHLPGKKQDYEKHENFKNAEQKKLYDGMNTHTNARVEAEINFKFREKYAAWEVRNQQWNAEEEPRRQQRRLKWEQEKAASEKEEAERLAAEMAAKSRVEFSLPSHMEDDADVPMEDERDEEI